MTIFFVHVYSQSTTPEFAIEDEDTMHKIKSRVGNFENKIL